ncbi:MAG: DMT family transporter [Nevskia sp.]
MAPTRTTLPTAIPGLALGATLIGFAAIVVRLVDIGPTAVAFWRLAIAVPALYLLRAATQPASAPRPGGRALVLLLLAGLAFAADLALWHRSIHLTSVANATLLSNLSPVFLALTLHFGFGEKHAPRFWVGLALALAGAAWLVADSLRIGPETALGDLLGAATAVFYAGYQLLVSRSRRLYSALDVMLWSSLAGAAVLLPLAAISGERLLPASLHDWLLLAVLGLVVHVGGQGLIAWAQAHLPASFASVTLLVQPVAAALFAWVLLGEGFGARQAIGAVIVLAGILLCRYSLPAKN